MNTKKRNNIIVTIIAVIFVIIVAGGSMVAYRLNSAVDAVNANINLFTISKSSLKQRLENVNHYSEWEIDYAIKHSNANFYQEALDFACENIDYMFDEHLCYYSAVDYICGEGGFTREQAEYALDTMKYTERQKIYAPILY